MLGCNCYAYCKNNPVNYLDSSGNSATAVLLAILAVLTFLTGCETKEKKYSYKPLKTDSSEYIQFENDFNDIVIAYHAEWGAELQHNDYWRYTGKLKIGIHIPYGNEEAAIKINDYINKWGYSKLASNLAQLGAIKYQKSSLNNEKMFPQGYEKKLGEAIYNSLIMFEEGTIELTNNLFISYTW